MANTSAAKKALRASQKKQIVNKARKNRIRSFIRKVEDAIKNKNQSNAKADFALLEKEIMRGVSKKVFKLNNAARKLSRLAAAIKKINQDSQGDKEDRSAINVA